MRLVQLALPAMRRRGEGRIVNVSSITGDADGPMLGWYETTKRALITLSDALRPELAAWGIDVVVVELGPFSTPIWAEPQVYERPSRRSTISLPGRATPERWRNWLGKAAGRAASLPVPRRRRRWPGSGVGTGGAHQRQGPVQPRGGGSVIATVARVIGAPPDAVAAVLADARSNDGVVVGSKRIRWFEARWPSRERSSTDGDPTHSGDSILRGTLS